MDIHRIFNLDGIQNIQLNSSYTLDKIIYQIFGPNEEYTLVMLALGHLLPFAFFFSSAFLVFGGAPYGKFRPMSSSWGPTLNNKLGWFIQELPTLFWPLAFLFFSESRQLTNNANFILLVAFMIHYIHRNFIFNYRKVTKPYEALFCSMMFFYVFFQVFVTTRYLSQYAVMDRDEIYKPRFIAGCVIFLVGFASNVHSDHLLINLRKNKSDKSYHIPRGGLYDYISGANFLGEVIEWLGFSIAAWNMPALSYFLMTCLNVIPRAFQVHQFYQLKFDDYPKSRKAFIPFVW